MGKAGGIIGIIAGIFGFIAALVTLLVGGLGSAFDAKGAESIVGFGWGGVLFSFLTIVFGAIAIGKPKAGGIGLLISSILGGVLGGTFVAICMVLSFIGGILAVIGGKNAQPIPVDVSVTGNATPKKKTAWIWILAILGMVIVGVIISAGKDSGKPKVDPLEELNNASASSLRPEGELGEMFALGSKNTDLQRDNMMSEITGQVVQWQLPVYEVSRSGDGYKIQTHSPVTFGASDPEVISAFVYITPRNDEERRIIEALKTDDLVSFKGRIAGSSLRHLEIKPALLASQESIQTQNETPVATTPAQEELAPSQDAGSDTCGDGGKIVFSCNTTNGKKIELCDSGATIDYSFGKLDQQPEMVVKAPRDHVSKSGNDTGTSYSVDILNGNTTYSVFWGVDRMSDDHAIDAGVYVLVNNDLVATVNCTETDMINNIDTLSP